MGGWGRDAGAPLWGAQILKDSQKLLHLSSEGMRGGLLFSCVICVDRMVWDVSSNNYAQASDLFQNREATGSVN